jgi:nucleosome binding factor SPN SPT16 subunit
MKCERLIKLIKNWYIQVQDEAMAPARMVDFMRTHLTDCQVCKTDPGIDLEIKKIIEIIMPAAKTPKAIRKEDAPGAGDLEEFDEAGDETEDGDVADSDEETDDGEESGDGLEDEELDDLDDDDI